jgi:hypothetical protein
MSLVRRGDDDLVTTTIALAGEDSLAEVWFPDSWAVPRLTPTDHLLVTDT